MPCGLAAIMSPQPPSAIALTRHLPSRRMTNIELREVTVFPPIVIVQTSSTEASESLRRKMFGLCVTFMSFIGLS